MKSLFLTFAIFSVTLMADQNISITPGSSIRIESQSEPANIYCTSSIPGTRCLCEMKTYQECNHFEGSRCLGTVTRQYYLLKRANATLGSFHKSTECAAEMSIRQECK